MHAISRARAGLARCSTLFPLFILSAAFVLISGGCPADEAVDLSNPTVLPGDIDSVGDEVEGLVASDYHIATVQDQPVTLSLAAPSGSDIELEFSVVSAPAVGSVSQVRSLDQTSAEVTYTPEENFVGQAQFSYQVSADGVESNVGTVVITVYPEVRFEVEVLAEQPYLTVLTYAFTRTGEELPEGTYAWGFDADLESGPVATHSAREHVFTNGGTHVITLTLTLAGLASQMSCATGPSGDDVEYQITSSEGGVLEVSPKDGFESLGAPGGPFDPESKIYELTNTGGAPLVWSASNTQNWVSLSDSTGTLRPGDSATVTVLINESANDLAAGTHGDTVSFKNDTNGVGSTTRDVLLTVDSSLDVQPDPALLQVTPDDDFASSGPQGGPFDPEAKTYTVTNIGGLPMQWQAVCSQDWVSLSSNSGTLPAGHSDTVVVTIDANANDLNAGVHEAIIGFANTTNGEGNTARFVTLTVNGQPGELSVAPAGGFSSSGPEGGPFSPASITYTLTNVGGQPIAWTATRTQSWVSLSSSGGTLAADASVNVVVSINAIANGLDAGSYADAVSFTNATNHDGDTTRDVLLTVNAPPGELSVSPSTDLISSGTEGGPFSPASITYTLTNVGGQPIAWTATRTQSWVSLSSSGGTLAADASVNVVVSINAIANGLGTGSYADAVSFTNATNHDGDTTRDVLLTVNAPPGDLFVSPSTNFVSSGPEGGPFDPASITYTLTNVGDQPIDWTATRTQSWVSLSSSGGTLAADASVNVVVSINTNANGLDAGSYADAVSFTNATNHDGDTTRDVLLTVNAPPGELSVSPSTDLVSSGTEGGPFDPASITYTLTNVGGQPIAWTATRTQSWVSLSSSGGTLAADASVNVVVSINANANGLAPGSYADAVSFTNATNHDGDTTRDVSLTVEDSGGCETSSSQWQNFAFGAQSGTFTAEFDVTPNAASIDAVTCLSSGAGAAYADFAVLVRFNPAGTIDARDGGVYRADTVISYVAGTGYHFRLVVDVPAHTYSVYVTPEGSGEQTIAANFAFRTEQNAVNTLDNWAIVAPVGSHQVCDFIVAPGADPGPGMLVVTPTGGLSSAGPEGGPFSPASVDYTLSNPGGAPIDWTASESALWLTLSSAAGTLEPGATETVAVSINSNANGLSAGSYNATVAFANVTNGTGDTTRDVNLTVNAPGEGVTPIARWDVVPHQRINAGETFNVGVVAFSKFGIQQVRFMISGQGYSGPTPIDVAEMTLNPRTGVWEYWAPIAAADFASDGPITVEAVVYGNDGGIRDRNTGGGGQGLDALPLIVDRTGNLVQPEAWVDVNGNDSTGEVKTDGIPGAPFRSIRRAADAIRAWRNSHGYGNNADGGIVRLNPGTHSEVGPGVDPIECDNEWLTVTTAAGGTRANTILSAAYAIYNIERVAIKGITLQRVEGQMFVVDCTSSLIYWAHVWVDDCNVFGYDRHADTPHPVGLNPQTKYWTDCYVYNVRRGTSRGNHRVTKLARGLEIEHIGGDAFQAVPLIINCTVDDMDPGDTGWHADAWQSPAYFDGEGIQNWIVYGLRATDLNYQGLFSRVTVPSEGLAFVNVFVENRGPGGNSFAGVYDHFLCWNVSVIGTDYNPGFDFVQESTTGEFGVTNSSFRGNLWHHFKTNQDSSWVNAGDVEFYDNHYIWDFVGSYNGYWVIRPDTAGDSATTGDPLLITDTADENFGRPADSSSPLVDRIVPCLSSIDASGRPRGGTGDAGGLEH